MRKTIATTLAGAALLAAAIGGCGGSSESTGGAYGGSSESGGRSYGGSAETAAASTPTAAKDAFVSVASVPKLGNVLVDSKGFTLYYFEKDRGGKSACYGACAGAWPPLLSEGSPKPSNGASAAKLGTTARNDGTTQVTYAGHPLYTYTADTAPGDANGNNVDAFGAEWYALTPKGTEP